MSTRRATAAANPEPDAAPGSPPTEINADSIDPRPNAEEDTGDHLMADQPQNDDVPGPSTTYMAPQDEPEPESTRARPPSPTMPSLRTRHFPPEDSDDEDDEVVAKLPVYLSPHLFPTLNLFQYPLRTETLVPPKYAQERNKFITTRVKEGVGRVEVEMPVDEDLNYWRRERAEELGFVRDINEDESGVVGGYGFGGRSDRDKEKSKGKKKEKHWGEKMRLKSEPIPSETGYYSGIIQDGALYLHPVSKVAQFRASLGYLDDFDEKVRTRNMRRKEEPEDKKAKPSGISQLGMPNRAKKGEEENDGSGSLKQFREKMWSMAREEEEDPWITYAWKYGEDEDAVSKAFTKLLVSPDKRDQLACKTRPLDYLDNPRNRDDLFKR